jgi:hypothetical protein
MAKRAFSFQGWDIQAYMQSEKYARAIASIYDEAVNEFARIGKDLRPSPSKLFSFNDYPAAKRKADEILNGMAGKMKAKIIEGTEKNWLFASAKNDAFLSSIMDTSKVSKRLLNKYQNRNIEALHSFQKRKVGGLDLSGRVWNYAGQMKKQMEFGLDIAIGEGRSAKELATDLKKYLAEPDKLFRRVRDKHGNLVLSRTAANYHPGQGGYRSSYRNALRLTRTEINMAYRESDQLRWQQLDFVIGYEVKRSNNEYDCDVCGSLAGRYPKDFKFVGWHPQCRCHAIPILQEPDTFDSDELEELKAAINGTEYERNVSGKITDVPDGFKVWVTDNKERAKGWKSQPLFIRNNFNNGRIDGGLKLSAQAK